MDNYAITKWAGGKQRELKKIVENLPKDIKIERYFEPFVGGGSVVGTLMNLNFSNEYYINDISEDLINLYKYIKINNKTFFNFAKKIGNLWNEIENLSNKHINEGKLLEKYREFEKNKITELEFRGFISSNIILDSVNIKTLFSDIFSIEILDSLLMTEDIIYSKFNRAKKISFEKQIKFSNEDINNTIESAYKTVIYNVLRKFYNRSFYYKIKTEFKTALFLFLREYCYGSMFRFNSNGEFNIPYGGIGYNHKKIETKLDKYTHLSKMYKKNNLYINHEDFGDFFNKFDFSKNDFIFLDPPYTTTFNEYDNNEFTLMEHEKLKDILLKTKAKFMLIIDSSEQILKLYENKKFNIIKYEKRYSVNIKNRNKQDIVHLLITNY